MSRPTGAFGVLLAVAIVNGVLAAGSLVAAVAYADPDGPASASAGTTPGPAAAPGLGPAVGAARCAAPTGATPAASGSAGATVVTFAVPAQTFVRVDDAGTPVAAMTNTRCPPAASDEIVVIDATGRPVSGSNVDPVGVRWSGDWSEAGSWHAWPVG